MSVSRFCIVDRVVQSSGWSKRHRDKKSVECWIGLSVVRKEIGEGEGNQTSLLLYLCGLSVPLSLSVPVLRYRM